MSSARWGTGRKTGNKMFLPEWWAGEPLHLGINFEAAFSPKSEVQHRKPGVPCLLSTSTFSWINGVIPLLSLIFSLPSFTTSPLNHGPEPYSQLNENIYFSLFCSKCSLTWLAHLMFGMRTQLPALSFPHGTPNHTTVWWMSTGLNMLLKQETTVSKIRKSITVSGANTQKISAFSFNTLLQRKMRS